MPTRTAARGIVMQLEKTLSLAEGHHGHRSSIRGAIHFHHDVLSGVQRPHVFT